MDRDEYLAANYMAAMVANTIEQLPLAQMAAAVERAQAIGPILDPTLYREKADDLQIDADRIRILRRAQVDLQRLRARAEA